jgi:MFS family permease
MSTGSTGADVSSRRILTASLVGTTIEYYDFYIYATAASLVFGPLFFPASSPSAQLLSAYASFGLAFVARPLGSVVFGHFGDRIGRKSTLVASLLIMGISTLLIGFLPTYDTAGWLAPVALCLLRFGQGIGLGGEWGGATLLAVENAPPGYRARFGMTPQFGAPLGFIMANGAFLLIGLLLTTEQFLAWGWRLPFLASIVLVILGLWIRLRIHETPAFAAAIAKAPPPRVPLGEMLRDYPRQTIGGIFAGVVSFAIFYLATAFALGYGTSTLGFAREPLLIVQLGAIAFMAVGIYTAGVLADRFDARRVVMTGCIGTFAAGFLMAPLMESGSLLMTWLFLSTILFLMGLTFGPLGAWLSELFAARVRYTGTSVAFNTAGILGGAVAPFAAQTLAQSGGLSSVGLYLSAAGIVSLLGLMMVKH